MSVQRMRGYSHVARWQDWLRPKDPSLQGENIFLILHVTRGGDHVVPETKVRYGKARAAAERRQVGEDFLF